MPLPKPECEGGYPRAQVTAILAATNNTIEKFDHWMRGQTMMLCTGQRYNHDTREYEISCAGEAHGGIVYPWDLKRFLERKPVID